MCFRDAGFILSASAGTALHWNSEWEWCSLACGEAPGNGAQLFWCVVIVRPAVEWVALQRIQRSMKDWTFSESRERKDGNKALVYRMIIQLLRDALRKDKQTCTCKDRMNHHETQDEVMFTYPVPVDIQKHNVQQWTQRLEEMSF